MRGLGTQPRSQKAPELTPWLACPTGPVSQPTEMLVHFATQRELPRGNSLPIAIALQEGLLLANSHPDLAERIKNDAYAWLQLALDIDEQLNAQPPHPTSQFPISAQLAWACRYHGRPVLNTVDQHPVHGGRHQASSDTETLRRGQGDFKENLARGPHAQNNTPERNLSRFPPHEHHTKAGGHERTHERSGRVFSIGFEGSSAAPLPWTVFPTHANKFHPSYYCPGFRT